MDIPALINQLGFPIAITVILLVAMGVIANKVWEFVQADRAEARQDVLQSRAEVAQAREDVAMARKDALAEMGQARAEFLASLRERDTQFAKQAESFDRMSRTLEGIHREITRPKTGPQGQRRRSNDEP